MAKKITRKVGKSTVTVGKPMKGETVTVNGVERPVNRKGRNLSPANLGSGTLGKAAKDLQKAPRKRIKKAGTT